MDILRVEHLDINLADYLGNNRGSRRQKDFNLADERCKKCIQNYAKAYIEKKYRQSVSDSELLQLKKEMADAINNFFEISDDGFTNEIMLFQNAETKIARNIKSCSSEQQSLIIANVLRSDTFSILSTMNNKSKSCLIEALNRAGTNKIGLENYLLRRLIGSANLIGKESAMGTAFALNNKEGRTLFVAKISEENPDDIAHEVIIGMLAINPVTEKVPNFVYTYGVLDCGYPKINRETKEVEFCDVSGVRSLHVIIENVENPYTLQDLIEEIDVDDFANIYLQIVNAINVAYKITKFTHYDLHVNNVLIQKLDSPAAIPIYIEGKTKYLMTSYLIKIIDYGQSYSKIQGYDVGVYIDIGGFTSETPYEICDAYKYIYSVGSGYTESKNNKVYNLLNYIYTTFFEEFPSLEDRFTLNRNKFGIFENGEPIYDLRHLKLQNLLQFCIQIYERYSVLLDDIPTGVKIARSEDRDILINNNKIDNLIDYALTVDATYKLPDSVEKINLLRTIRNVNILELFNREVADVEQRIREDSSSENIREISFWTVAAHYALKYKKIEDKNLYAKIAEIVANTKKCTRCSSSITSNSIS